MSSPSSLGKTIVVPGWEREENVGFGRRNEVVVFFLSLLVLSSLFLPIFSVISASRDPDQDYYRRPLTPSTGTI